MDIDKIKQRILDLAIRGKLVSQDPNDEPASVLIEKIKAEKEKMIKEGKIKPSKDDSYIYKTSDNCYYEKKGNTVKNITSEIPFDIPENWCWVRLSSISAEIQYGLNYSAKAFGNNKYLRITDIQNNNVNWDDVPFITIKEGEEDHLLQNNDIVFARTGATVGKSFLIKNIPLNATFASYLIRTKLINKEIAEYIYYFFNSSFYWKQIFDKSIGNGQPNCNGTKLASLIIPIPSENEIMRIVKKISELLFKIDIIKSEENAIRLISDKIKSKILDFFFGDNSSYKSYYEKEFELGKIIEYEQPTDYIVKNPEYDDKYATPVLTAGKSFLLGYTNETEGVYHIKCGEKVIIFDDFTTSSHLVDFDFKVKSSAMKILRSTDNELFNIEYLYYFLKTLKIDTDNHKRYWISKYAPMKVKVHTYEEQCKIVQAIKKIQYTLLNIE